MSVDDTTATTVAQDNQIPPALRNWARLQCHGVRRIDRFDPDNETHGRGWIIEGSILRPKHLPDEYRLGNVSAVDSGALRMQVREE